MAASVVGSRHGSVSPKDFLPFVSWWFNPP